LFLLITQHSVLITQYMNKGKETFQRILAIIVIIAMLGVMRIPFSVVILFAVVAYFIWRAVQKSELQEATHIFEFYISANDILRDEDRHWFGYEITDVISRGERILNSMSDPPPLVYFAVGALCHKAQQHEKAEQHLAYIVENDLSDERHRLIPSPELRRYVKILRKIEREPTEAPLSMAAVRSLERARRHRAATMLEKTREQLKIKHAIDEKRQKDKANETVFNFEPPQHILTGVPHTVLAPPPIVEVLRDVYEEEKKSA
jgi:hypothetical protein